MGAALYCKSCSCHWYAMHPVDPDYAECPDCGDENSRFDVSRWTRFRWWLRRISSRTAEAK